jgi:hypothetical protein
MPLTKATGERLGRLGVAKEIGAVEKGSPTLSIPAALGFTDNMLSRTALQISSVSLSHGEPSRAPMFIGLCCMTRFMETRPEQACATERNTMRKAATEAVMIESVFDMVIWLFLLKGYHLTSACQFAHFSVLAGQKDASVDWTPF